ncbi:chromosome segregation ATPase [Encephalitozoon cuniculi EcunIII-L]|uniref:Chromosome segregation protein n=1 Tax=Encephalitozoon cuniculi TaxID=6035 RepID=M1K832_ENCCN|nr:chromosome segregation protein [Encephalitozoon cuniculi]KMV66296.1 chromosome segregation ATPase [Encephalitozoon cuniculi EcunIII-L]
MGLERIEVENFKSYLGVHVIGPFDRFTCIVGPNGSGKSNVMDAVMFCLGVGSRYLRGSSARSLINSKCNHCSVTLYIEGCGERRSFQRHVNWEGRSSYFVDSENASYERFKEVVEGMNLLVDARNFLVFQGDVGVIGGMMPMELSRLFEEMSGSVKLKDVYEEKQRVQARAVSECASLFEEKKEVMSRMKEAEEARAQEDVFRKLIERKHRIQEEMVLHEIQIRKARRKDADDEVSRLEAESRRMQEFMDDKEREVEVYRGKISEMRREYFEVDAHLSRQREMLAERRARKYEVEQERDKRRARAVEIEMEIRGKKDAADAKRQEIERRRKEVEAVDGGYEEMCKEEERRRRRLQGIEEKKDVIEEKEREFLQACGEDLEDLSGLDLEMFSKKMLLDDCRERMEKLEEKGSELRQMVEEKRKARMNVLVKIDALERSESELCGRISLHERRYRELVSEEKRRNEELSWILGEILRTKGRRKIDSRRSMIQGAVETLKGMFPGVYGRVVDLVKATQDRYEIALSVLLGSHDQSVIVDTERTAMSCINFIKEKRLCKMTFLPIESIRDGSEGRGAGNASWEVEEYGGAVRRAVDAITYDGKYRKVVSFLFREKLIADSVEIARDICYGREIKASVCALDGTYIHGGGSLMSGGGVGRNKFQEDELDELMGRRIRVLEELRKIQDAKGEVSHVEICRERIEMWRRSKALEMEALRELDSCIEELELQRTENGRLVKEAEESLECVLRDIGVSEGRMKELEERIRKAESSVFRGIFPNDYFRSFGEYKEARENEVFALRTMEYEGVKAKAELRIEVLRQEIEDLDEEVERLRREAEDLNKEPDGGLGDVDAMCKDLASLEERRKRSLETFEKARDEFKEVNEEFRRLVEQKNKLDQGIVSGTSSRERLEEEIKDLLSFAALEEIEVPCIGCRRPASGVSVDEIDFSGLEGSIEDLKRELEEINQKINSRVPLAKAERGGDLARYMEINAEYERRKAIAIAAKNEFNEVKKRRAHMFMECFEKVNKEISRIYKSLTMTETAEGNAYLVLENTSEPFKEGIRFHLMPPNKRFREVRLLSGGEKTMAVLSLLFSFHAYKPAPFYMFDEVDSALDKINASRIVSFIVSSNAQFILITLKPALFQHSDGLVGVYRDPHEGVSKVLTYRLND